MKRGNRGQVLVLLAISILVLLGMVALAVDLGYLWSVRHELQRCADAGALAGASRFIPPDTGDWADTTVQAEAEARARDFASRDKVATSTLKPAPADNEIIVTIDSADPGVDRIKVRTQRVMPLFFARVFGRQSQLVYAEAVAEAATLTKNVRCLVPWAVSLPWSNFDPELVEQGRDPKYVFDNSDVVHTLAESEAYCAQQNLGVTAYDVATHQIIGEPSERDNYLCQGSLRILKTALPGETMQPGWFSPLDFSSLLVNCPDDAPVDQGANLYRYLIMDPCACGTKISLNDPLFQIPQEKGNMVGPTIQGVAPEGEGGWDGSIMDDDPGAYWDTDSNSPVSGKYFGDNTYKSPRIIRVPLYDPSQGLLKKSVDPVNIVGFWVEDISEHQGTVTGRFVTVPGLGEDGGGEGEGSTVKMLRLVK